MMNIKLNRIKFRSLMFLFILLIGCVKDPNSGDISLENSSIKLTINSGIKVGEASASDVLYAEESHIKNITLIVFNVDESGDFIFEKNRFYDYAGSSESSKNITLRVHNHNSKKIFAIVNSSETRTKSIKTITALNDFQWESVEYFNAVGSEFIHAGANNTFFEMFPMSGETTTFNATSSTVIDMPIDVSRCYARVDVKLKIDAASCSFTSVNTDATTNYTTSVAAKGNFFDALLTPPAENLVNVDVTNGTSTQKTINTTNFTHIFSVYTPARQYGADDTKMKIDIKNLVTGDGSKFDLNSIILETTMSEGSNSAITELKPNHIYNVQATIKSRAEAIIVDWEVKDIEQNVGGVKIYAPNTVWMDYDKYNTYSYSIDYSSNHNVKIFIRDIEVDYDFYINHSQGDPKWLRDIYVLKNNEGRSGSINIHYKVAEEDRKKTFEIVLKSGNINRVISVKYADKLLLLPESRFIPVDYAKFIDKTGKRGSFTGKFIYEYSIDTDIINPIPAFPPWLKSIVQGGDDDRKTIDITYIPTPMKVDVSTGEFIEHDSYDIRVDGTDYTLVYDNGFISHEIMDKIESDGNFKQIEADGPNYTYGVHNRNNWASNGFHFAKRGQDINDDFIHGEQLFAGGIDPFTSDTESYYDDEKLQWDSSSPESIPDIIDNDYRYNNGKAYTNILQRCSESGPYNNCSHMAAMFCKYTGAAYYLPGISDLKWIYDYAHQYLGPSYSFAPEIYWSATSHDQHNSLTVDRFGTVGFWEKSTGYAVRVRCIKDL